MAKKEPDSYMERHEKFNRDLAIFFFVSIDYLNWRLSHVKHPFSKMFYRFAKAECEALMTLLPELTPEDTYGINLNWGRLAEHIEREMEIVLNYRRNECCDASDKKFYDIMYDHLNNLFIEIQEVETEYDIREQNKAEPFMYD